MSGSWNWLVNVACAEVEATMASLPADLRAAAGEVPVICEPVPGPALLEEGWDEDLLGLFVGDPVGTSEPAPIPRQIVLFLENLWDFAEADEVIYREEVRITYIHEFGHYLGLDEDELEARGLL